MACVESFKGKVAVVTGSTSGIGRGVAHSLASRGCSVVLTGIATEEEITKLIEEFKSQYEGPFHFVPGDFRQIPQIQKFCQDVLAIYPDGIDILVSNAGIPARGSIEDFTIEQWTDSLTVNLTTPFILTKTFFPLMKKKGWGRIILMSSQNGLIAAEYKIGYCTPKAGLLGFARVVTIEGAPYGITCNAICPGSTDAPMCHSIFAKDAADRGLSFEEAKIEHGKKVTLSGRLIPVSHVAELVAFLCSEAGSSISGSPIPIDTGYVIR